MLESKPSSMMGVSAGHSVLPGTVFKCYFLVAGGARHTCGRAATSSPDLLGGSAAERRVWETCGLLFL